VAEPTAPALNLREAAIRLDALLAGSGRVREPLRAQAGELSADIRSMAEILAEAWDTTSRQWISEEAAPGQIIAKLFSGGGSDGDESRRRLIVCMKALFLS
jgi:hypothetical protein